MLYLGIFLSLLASIASVSAQDLEIFPKGDSHTRPIDGTVVFTCTVTGISDPNVQPQLKWFDYSGTQIIDKTGRLYIENVGMQELKLYITKIHNSDAGRYTCEGTIEGNRVEKSITLMLFKDITFDSAPTPQHPEIFTDATIECIVTGQPVPEVSWKYKGSVLSTGERYIVDAKGLKIKKITEDDNGEYQCRAEVQSDGRLDYRQIDVVVHIPPKMTKGPGEVEGIEKHEVSLSCEASGKPAPKWEFYKDDSKQPISSTETRTVDTEAGVIHFRPIHRDEGGEYECVAINDVGEDRAKGELKVIVPPRILEYKEVVGEEGKGTTLTCLAEGDPPPQMVFRKVGTDKDYEEGENDNGHVLVEKVDPRRATLTINSLIPSDTANYTCTCRNTGGMHSLNSTITVYYKPRFSEDHEKEVYSWAGKTRNMTCHAIADPTPFIRWYLFGKELVNNETFRIFNMGKNSALQITVRQEDQGWIYSTYTCSADNGYGIGEQLMSLKRAEVPEKPKEVHVKEQSPTMVILTVVPSDDDGGVPVYAYRVEYDQHVQDFKIGEEIRIENLRPSTPYLFRIRAKNEVGVSNPTEMSLTTESMRTPYPLVITSDPEGKYPYEYELRWEKPKTGGLPIQEYKFRYRQVKVDDNGAINPVNDWIVQYQNDDPEQPMLYYRLEGLKQNTHFQIAATARNEMGWSLDNEDFVFKTAEGGYDDGRIGEVGAGVQITMATGLLAISCLLGLLETL